MSYNGYFEVTEQNVEDHIDHIVNWIRKYFVNHLSEEHKKLN